MPQSTAAALVASLQRRGLDPQATEKFVLGGCTIVGGYGLPWPAGTRCDLTIVDAVFRLTAMDGSSWAFSLDEVVALQTGGPGAVTKGGGFIGGGFGLAGVVEGMLVASALNAATKKTTISTLLRITGRQAEAILHNSSMTPQTLDLRLSPVLGRLRAREHQALATSAAPARSMVEELAQLAELHASGALTAQEFDAAKARLLANP